MRELAAKDIPAFCRCLKKIGIKDEVRNIAQNSNNVADAWNKGFDLIYNIFDLATEKEGEQYLYEFLAGPFEMTAEEVSNLPLGTLSDNLKFVFGKIDIASFFKSAVKSMK